jgi:glycosyltransferase involved in cell wall biosynthesis
MSAETPRALRIAYLCLQVTHEGQASHAHVHEIVDGLQAEGHTVDLFQPSYGDAAPGAFGRVMAFRRLQRDLAPRLPGYDALYIRGHALARPSAVRAKRLGVPVIQECNGPYRDLFLAWPAARYAAWWFVRAMCEQFREADAVVAVTPGLAEWVRSETGRTDVTVVPNGVNVGLFTPGLSALPSLPARYAVFFGALAPWQGVESILKARRSPAWPADVALAIAGDGALRPLVDSAAATDSGIFALGRVPYRHVARLVGPAVASLVVMDDAARAETGLSPLKLYESMACATPVVASDTSGVAETVAGCGCGVLVAPGDPEAIAEAVARLAADPAGAAVMGAAGRDAAVREHSWRARATATARVIGDAVARKRES